MNHVSDSVSVVDVHDPWHPRVVRTLHVGDEPRDIMAALGAGFGASVAVATGAASFKYLQTHQVFKPDYVIHSMAELIDLIDNMKTETVE